MTVPNQPADAWAEALEISAQQMGEWSAQVPEGKPVLVWGLEEGHISLVDYLGWAQDRSGLAILSGAFFSGDGGFDPEFLANQLAVEAQNIWTPWHFPVSSWDGVLFIACVELPAENPPDDKRYVLADARVLAEAWSSVQPAGQTPPPLMDIPQGLSLTVKPFVLNFDEASLELETGVHMSAPTLPEKKPTAPANVLPFTPPVPAEAPLALELEDTNDTPPELVGEMIFPATFTELQSVYEHSCVVRFSEKNLALLEHWSPTLKPVDEGRNATLDLTAPNFLRIVNKTGQPYHGYLVDSPAHRDYFVALGLDQNPACVTAVPFKVGGHTWGALIALGKESAQIADNLTMVRDLAERLGRSIPLVKAA